RHRRQKSPARAILKLEREQAALARRIQELRAAVEAAANANASVSPGPACVSPKPGRGREHMDLRIARVDGIVEIDSQ
ncbi:hypothetical protein FRC07_006956, partial [Ceratobasidium sp. 392]